MPSFMGSGAGRFVRRSAVVAMALVLAGGAAGFAYGRSLDASHEATAVVLIHPTEGNPFSPGPGDDLVNLATEAELVTADAVGRAVADREPGVDLADVLADVSAVVPANTQLIRITVTHPDVRVAVARAQAFADSYLDYRATRTTSALFDRGAHLTEQIRSAEASLADRFERLANLLPAAAGRSQVEQQIEVLTAQLAQLRTEQAAIRSTAQAPGEVVTPAASSSAGPVPATLWASGSGALLGLALGGTLVVARLRSGDRVEGVADLEAAGHELLGTWDEPTEVRARLLVSDPRRPLVVLVAGTDAGMVPPLTSARLLAECFARAQLETVHVDLAVDVDHDALPVPQSGGWSRRTGLLDVLHEVAVVDDALITLGPHLQRVSLGTTLVASDLQDLMGAPVVQRIFDDLRKRTDVVLVTGMDITDPAAQQLLMHVDVLVPWVTRHGSTLSGLGNATALAHAAGVRVSGVVYDESRRRPRKGADEHR